jgi:hypothetical protein
MAISISTCTAARRINYIGVTFRTRTIEEVREIFDEVRKDIWARWNRENCNCRSTRSIRSPNRQGVRAHGSQQAPRQDRGDAVPMTLQCLLDGGRYFEGPRWHAGRLWFVDCMERTLLSLSPSGEREQHAKFEATRPAAPASCRTDGLSS